MNIVPPVFPWGVEMGDVQTWSLSRSPLDIVHLPLQGWQHSVKNCLALKWLSLSCIQFSVSSQRYFWFAITRKKILWKINTNSCYTFSSWFSAAQSFTGCQQYGDLFLKDIVRCGFNKRDVSLQRAEKHYQESPSPLVDLSLLHVSHQALLLYCFGY